MFATGTRLFLFLPLYQPLPRASSLAETTRLPPPARGLILFLLAHTQRGLQRWLCTYFIPAHH